MFTPPEEIAVLVRQHGRRPQVSSRIRPLRLERNGVGLVVGNLDVGIQIMCRGSRIGKRPADNQTVEAGRLPEVDARVAHCTEAREVIVSLLQVCRREILSFFNQRVVFKHTPTEMEARGIAWNEVDLVDDVAWVKRRPGTAAFNIFHQMQRHTYMLSALGGISCIIDEILMESIVAGVIEDMRKPFAFIVQRSNSKLVRTLRV